MKRLCLALLLLPLLAVVVTAEEPSPALELELEYLDLLPLGEFEREDFVAEHEAPAKKVQGLRYQLLRRQKELSKRKKKDDKAGQKLSAIIAGHRQKARAPLAKLREASRAHGLTDEMLAAMAAATEGRGRVERYGHRLVLLLDDLDPTQRAIFERVIPEVDGAYLAAQAYRDRTELGLKQSGLDKRQVNAVLNGFSRQTRLIENRFWRLVDYVLHEDQKAALWEMLPQPLRRHASPADHVYALPGLAPAQAARVRALITEVEAETAPDQALVQRTKKRLAAKGLSKKERQAIQEEQRDAYRRMKALRRYAHEAAKEILTPEQIHAMKGIPPRVSINDRRRDGKRVLQGLSFDAEQEKALARLRKEGKEAGRRYQIRVRELKRDQGDVGPDSPQQMMMEMMMQGARGEAMAAQRHLLGRVFREVLTADQRSGWVMGLYGDRR